MGPAVGRGRVGIPDDPGTQLGVRFALFQLWCNVNRHDESAVGARGSVRHGLCGACVLGCGRVRAARHGRASTRVPLGPWCVTACAGSARRVPMPQRAATTARDFPGSRLLGRGGRTPRQRAPRRHGGADPDGQLEEHITADVAWAAALRAWTGGGRVGPPGRNAAGGDRALLGFPSAPRYWRLRSHRYGHRPGRIPRVGERQRLHQCDGAVEPAGRRGRRRPGRDRADIQALAGAGRHGWSTATTRRPGVTSSLPDTSGSSPCSSRSSPTRPWRLTCSSGRDRLAGSQIIKQPDVLMLHHLVPSQVRPGSLGPNLDFYGPRTAHGSSLSPAVTAPLLARAGPGRRGAGHARPRAPARSSGTPAA